MEELMRKVEDRNTRRTFVRRAIEEGYQYNDVRPSISPRMINQLILT